MALSRYCALLRNRQNPAESILYSTKRASALSLPAEFIHDIMEDNLTVEERAELTGLDIVVENPEAEAAYMAGYMERMNAENKGIMAVVVMNMECNLACTYCFEGSRKSRVFMSEETGLGFAGFVKHRVEAQGLNDIKVMYYGGEPLLSLEHVCRISEELKAFGVEKGIKYRGSIITNGTLLTRSVSERLMSAGITAAKVTLDGPKEVHDSCRPYKGGSGSFDMILRNLKESAGLLKIQVGGNYEKDNYREFPRLLDVFEAEGLTPDRIAAVKFDPVLREGEGFGPPEFTGGCDCLNEPWLIHASIYLREEVLRRGYATPMLRPMPCTMEAVNTVVMAHDGTFYKCPGLIGRPGLTAGSLKEGLIERRTELHLDNWKNEECLACPYLPLCFGGCRYMKLIRDGSMQGVDCKRPYFEATLEAFVNQDLVYNVKQ